MSEFQTIEKVHWDKNWRSARPRGRLNRANVFNFYLTRLLNANIRNIARPKVMEIGCVPGKTLLYLEQHHGAMCLGVDYSPVGCEVSRKFLSEFNSSAKILCADVTKDRIDISDCDLVYSIGVVEHFADPTVIVDAHITALRQGGRALIVLPNYSGMNQWLQSRLDPENLALHNLELMKKQFWMRFFQQRQDVSATFFLYGGFSPWLLSLRPLGKFGVLLKVLTNFLSFLVPPALSPSKSMIVVQITKLTER